MCVYALSSVSAFPFFGLFIRPFVANVWVDGHIDAVVLLFLGYYFASCAIRYLSSSLVN